MNKKITLKAVSTILLATTLSGGLAGCVEEKNLNTDTVIYEPEERALGIIAGEGAEYEPGATVSLSGRLVGTVTNQTVLWSQTSGTPIEGITDWTDAVITFTAPDVIGIEGFTFKISAIESDGSVAVDTDGNPLVDETEIVVFDPATKVFYQIEDESVAELTSVDICSSGDDCYLNGASGDHTNDFTPGASVKFTIDSEEDAFVTLYGAFGIPSSGYGSKNAIISVNEVDTEIVIEATGSISEYRIGVIKLNAGENIIEVGGGWNYYRLDYLMTVPAAQPAAPLPVPSTLVNANASGEALALIEFLTQNYSTSSLSGQTEFPESATPLAEFDKVVAATGGDAPAIVAFDYMNYSSSTTGSVNSTLTESMIEAKHDKNVILSALFHWRAPSGGAAFYTNDTTFDVEAALADTSSAEYAELLVDIDIIAAELKKLADADIPVLWRPLHEAQGGWFWWGAKGSTAFKELWALMYDRLTDHHGLNNLIWVFTHSGDLNADWYPGDNMVDIVGYDGYADPLNDDEATFSSQFSTLKSRHDGKKLVALTETGTIPNVATMHEQDAWWSFFITWNSETWDSTSLIGPDGAEAAVIKENYATESLLNLDDVPGGREKVEAGIYDGFEVSTANFEAQINWAATTGISTSDKWATSGSRALSLVKDLSVEADVPTGIMFQVYPTGGLDVSEVSTITVSGNTINAGVGTTIKLFIKHGDDWAWVDSGAVAVVEGGVELEIDLTEFDWLAGFGFQIEGVDSTATAAEFYLDNVRLDDAVIYDFEPDTSGFESQINWSGVSGITVTDDWSTKGNRALTLIKDLSTLTDPTGAMFQVYPEGGIDVTDVSTVKVSGNAIGAGDGTTVKLFVKYGDDWAWADGGAVTIVDGGVELEVDVSAYNWLAGIGFQYEGIDATATDARFYLDNVRLDDSTIYDFEGTGEWGFQTGWAPTPGLHISKDWSAQGNNALAAKTDATADIVFQVYPTGGLLLGEVSTLKITVNTINAGADVNAHIFWKSPSGAESWPAAVAVTESGVELTVDLIADGAKVDELSGFGVRFQAPNNTSTEAQFLIDNIEFE
ncbi:MAG: glycosyl hydrolase [Colwellia sp.]